MNRGGYTGYYHKNLKDTAANGRTGNRPFPGKNGRDLGVVSVRDDIDLWRAQFISGRYLQGLMNIAAIGLMVTFTVMTGAVLHTVGVTQRRSLSEHIAKSPRTILFGKIGLTLGGLFFLLALLGYVSSKYQLDVWFAGIVILAGILGTATAYLPYNISKRQDFVHDVCSYGYVVLNPIILAIICMVLPDGYLRIGYEVGLLMQVIMIGVLVLSRPARRYFLFGQIAFMSIFALLLIVS